MNKLLKTDELFDYDDSFLKPFFCNCTYPWELLSHIGEYISQITEDGMDGYTITENGILMGRNVKIYPNVVIEGPAVIGSGTELRPGAFLRPNVIIGENCVIGNSTEIKNSILLNNVQIPHYNYVGDSILGNYAHMGAGSICSNFKSDGKSIVVHGDEEYKTGLRKLGAILGDGADIGCGCVLNPGTVIGKRTSVYPTLSLRGVFPPDYIIKAEDLWVRRENRQ